MKKWFLYSPAYDTVFFFLPFFVAVSFALVTSSFFPEIAYPALSPLWFFLFTVVFDVGHVWGTLYRGYFHRKNFALRKKLLLSVPIIAVSLLAILGVISYKSGNDPYLYPVYFLAWFAVFHFIKQQVGFVLLYGKKEGSDTFGWRRRIDTWMTWMVTGIPMIYWWTHYDTVSFEWFEVGEFQIFADIFPSIPFLWIVYSIGIFLYILVQMLFVWSGQKPNPLKYLYLFGTAMVWYLGIVHYNSAIIFGFGNILVHGMNYYGLVIGSSLAERENYGRFFQKILFRIAFLLIPFSLIVFAFAEEFFWDQFLWQQHKTVFSDIFYDHILSEPVLVCIVALLGSIQLTHYILDRYIWRGDFGEIVPRGSE